MLLHSHPVASARHVEPEVTQHGILHHLFILKKILFVFLQLFVHIQESLWIQKRHY